ncbi:hypothetical protein ASPZODRAFT_18662 [Penicilliopsis zonata CBS 506.65]|uniref:Restriction endonuclease type IV Mrr domain-containing protein n=1 Tax=Penicilliopsis zonata CBS 506.65 TaxID=1073090 RepID=A0A1L9SBD5_9EURO|nr:hypothetical protein ASPZODRAFT_18662 [Penicilliopsis zonata CBS 506.65]OJJ44471.1 hypothetical protein ASPZODRAFT_18662 [Penicilliopsis zonata CBS 506.65]
MSLYLSIPAISNEINRIRRSRYESVLYGVWTSILTWQFPVTEGYVTCPQARHGSQSGERGWSDLHTYHYPNGSNTADRFLFVQCKRRGGPATWRDGLDQLLRYVRATHRTRRYGRRSPVYGILCVGEMVRLYKYHDPTRTLRPFAPPGLATGDEWNIRLDARKVQRILNYILRHH